MSTSYSAVIVVGLPRDEIIDCDLIDEHDMDTFHTGDDTMVAGFRYISSGEYSYNELIWNQGKIDDLAQRFETITSQKAKVIITVHSY